MVDRDAVFLFFVTIPLCLIGSVPTMWLLRIFLRSRIQPNKNYPGPPEIPEDMPPALFLDEDAETLITAEPKWKLKRLPGEVPR